MDITPSLRAKMLTTAKSMREQGLSYMEVEGVDGFFVTLDELPENGIVLGAETIEEVKYFLCWFDE